jgi:hypothetical protein
MLLYVVDKLGDNGPSLLPIARGCVNRIGMVGSFIIHSYACQYIVDHVRAISFECRVDV